MKLKELNVCAWKETASVINIIRGKTVGKHSEKKVDPNMRTSQSNLTNKKLYPKKNFEASNTILNFYVKRMKYSETNVKRA